MSPGPPAAALLGETGRAPPFADHDHARGSIVNGRWRVVVILLDDDALLNRRRDDNRGWRAHDHRGRPAEDTGAADDLVEHGESAEPEGGVRPFCLFDDLQLSGIQGRSCGA